MANKKNTKKSVLNQKNIPVENAEEVINEESLNDLSKINSSVEEKPVEKIEKKEIKKEKLPKEKKEIKKEELPKQKKEIKKEKLPKEKKEVKKIEELNSDEFRLYQRTGFLPFK